MMRLLTMSTLVFAAGSVVANGGGVLRIYSQPGQWMSNVAMAQAVQ